MKSYFQTRIWRFSLNTINGKNERFDDVIQFIRSKMHFGNFNMRRKYEWTTLKPYLPCVPEQTMPRLLTTVERTSWRETGGGKLIHQFCSAIFSLAHSRTLKIRRACLLDLLMWRYDLLLGNRPEKHFSMSKGLVWSHIWAGVLIGRFYARDV